MDSSLMVSKKGCMSWFLCFCLVHVTVDFALSLSVCLNFSVSVCARNSRVSVIIINNGLPAINSSNYSSVFSIPVSSRLIIVVKKYNQTLITILLCLWWVLYASLLVLYLDSTCTPINEELLGIPVGVSRGFPSLLAKVCQYPLVVLRAAITTTSPSPLLLAYKYTPVILYVYVSLIRYVSAVAKFGNIPQWRYVRQ